MTLSDKVSKNLNVLKLLARYGLLESFFVEVLKDEKNENITLSDKKEEELFQNFKFKNGIEDEKQINEYCHNHFLSKNDLKYLIEKEEKSKNYSNQHFPSKVKTKSLSVNKKSDHVKYTLLRVSEEGLANELYLQLSEENANLKELINKYSEGPEKNSNGIIGPLPIEKSHPILVDQLRSAKSGQFLKPFQIENWWLIVRLESFISANIVKNTSFELYQEWLLVEAKKICSSLENQTANNNHFAFGDIS